ncbi:hypothetical protein ACH6CV_02280 [Bacillota bacterium Meth-B3]
MRRGHTFPGCVRADIRRMVLAPGLYVALALILLIQYQGVCEDLGFMDIDVLYLFTLSADIGKMQWLMPAVSTLVFSGAFFEDWSSKMHRAQLMRAARETYLSSKALCCFVGTFITVFAGVMLFVALLSMKFPLLLQSSDWAEHVASSGGALLNGGHILAYLLVLASFRACAAAMWATLGLCVSALCKSRLSLHLVPFLVSYAARFLNRILPTGAYSLFALEVGATRMTDPLLALRVTHGVYLTFTVFLSICFYFLGVRRLKDGS